MCGGLGAAHDGCVRQARDARPVRGRRRRGRCRPVPTSNSGIDSRFALYFSSRSRFQPPICGRWRVFWNSTDRATRLSSLPRLENRLDHSQNSTEFQICRWGQTGAAFRGQPTSAACSRSNAASPFLLCSGTQRLRIRSVYTRTRQTLGALTHPTRAHWGERERETQALGAL